MRKGAVLLILGLLALPMWPSSAAIYKWVDKNGNVTFSQTPPPAKAGQNATVTSTNNDEDDFARDLPPGALDKFCGNVGDLAHKLARYMKAGYSADRALTAQASSAGAGLAKALVAFVWGFQGTDISASGVGDLARNQCMNGAYSRYLAQYVREHYPQYASRGHGKVHRRAGMVYSGTGWPVGHGYILTNNHVVGGSSHITLTLANGRTLQAHLVTADRVNDLALLSVDDASQLPPSLPLAHGPARIGSQVFTIGYPHVDVMGHTPKLTSGIISAEAGAGDDKRLYQISVPVQGGNSGGPLINMHGEVVGVVTAKLNAMAMLRRSGDLPENVNYAIKSRMVTAFLRETIGKRYPPAAIAPASGTLEDLAARVEHSVVLVIAR
jgi:S1-C subfamily serine protease